jgi:predicted AAA+ superfamily ATPase
MIALQNVFDKLIRKLEVKILILGFKGAGKTTILKRFEFGDIIKISNNNFEVENVNFNDVRFIS